MAESRVPQGRPVSELDALPRLGRELVRSVASGIGSRATTLPETVLRISDVAAGGERLDAYRQLCGFGSSSIVPSTWIHVLAFPLHMRLMSGKDAPFPLAGLVHVTNQITQERPVADHESVTLTGWLDGARRHRRGVLIDVSCEGSVGDEVVWRGESAYLVRGADLPGLSTQPSPERHPIGKDVPGIEIGQTWRLPADLGRQYAKVSGDVNPIHLSAITARPFGFPRPIIHGMWTHARALSPLESRLPDAYSVAVRWTKPIMLPATVRYGAQTRDDGWDLAVTNRGGDKIHLVGSVSGADSRGATQQR